ncbi:hypothetical protein [Klebsiella pneumoniae]|uniref:hypothetical protein n=1 Tax=Klebsiella pneumoniae TaxID=573 RepID=UPI000F245C98|nr:hypothetical protein [Klebsiella pneumoniae]VCX11190.1 hypothetical protein BANRA_05502 [Klebsiella pneumoniae]
MKKLIAVAAVVVVSFAAQSSVGASCVQSYFVVGRRLEKPIMLLDDKVSTEELNEPCI